MNLLNEIAVESKASSKFSWLVHICVVFCIQERTMKELLPTICKFVKFVHQYIVNPWAYIIGSMCWLIILVELRKIIEVAFAIMC